MTPGEIQFWQRVAKDLGIEVISPFETSFPDGSRLKCSALVRNFGAKNGMVVDADYHIIAPHIRALKKAGFGYSSNIGESPDKYQRDAMIDVLADWAWSGPLDQKPTWLR